MPAGSYNLKLDPDPVGPPPFSQQLVCCVFKIILCLSDREHTSHAFQFVYLGAYNSMPTLDPTPDLMPRLYLDDVNTQMSRVFDCGQFSFDTKNGIQLTLVPGRLLWLRLALV